MKVSFWVYSTNPSLTYQWRNISSMWSSPSTKAHILKLHSSSALSAQELSGRTTKGLSTMFSTALMGFLTCALSPRIDVSEAMTWKQCHWKVTYALVTQIILKPKGNSAEGMRCYNDIVMRMSLPEPPSANHKLWPHAFAPLLSCLQRMPFSQDTHPSSSTTAILTWVRNSGTTALWALQLSSCPWKYHRAEGSNMSCECHFSDSFTQRQELTKHKQTRALEDKHHLIFNS